MRFPWYIYIPLMLTAVGVTWYVRTKDMNFMPEVSEDRVVLEQQRPETEEFVGPPAPRKVDPAAFEAGEVLLGLDHFSNYRENPEELLRVFTILKDQENVELAYLAGERIMEHTQISVDNKRDQAVHLSRLADSLEPYVFDLNEVRDLEVIISGLPAELQPSVTAELSELVYNSSGGLVALTTTYEEGDPGLTATINDVKSFTPLTQDADLQEVISNFYVLLASEMSKNGREIPIWNDASSKEFTVALTRIAWEQLIKVPAEETPE